MEAEVYKNDYVQRIRGNFTDLVGNIDAKELLDYLFQEGAINEDDMEAVDCRPPRAGNRKLLTILSKKDYKAFGIFLDALRQKEGNQFVVDHLLNYDSSTCPVNSMEMEKEVESDKRLEMLNEQVWKQTSVLIDIQNKIDSMRLANTAQTGGETFDSAQVEELQDVTKNLKLHIQDYVDSQISKSLASRGITPDVTAQRQKLYEDVRKSDENAAPSRRLDPNIEQISVHLAKDIIQYLTVGSDIAEEADVYAKTMRRLVSEILEQQSEFFKQVMINLPVDEMNGLETICAVADEMLQGGYHWGKVIVLYSYVGWVGKFFQKPGKTKETDEFLDGLGNFLGYYVDNRLGKWIQQHGGWDDFLKRFPERTGEAGEGRLVNTLIWTAVGLGAVTTLVLATK